jgi:hypothetical protein
MTTRKSNLWLLALLLALGCGRVVGGPRQTVTIERKWPAAAIERLKVSEVGGNIEVQAVDTNEISLVATVRGSDLEIKPDRENKGLFETHLDGDTLRIGRREKNHFNFVLFDKDEVEIDYTLRVPQSVSLDVNTVNGRIRTRGNVDGETEATTVNGTIDIEASGSSELKASTVNGRVRAKFLRSFQGAKFRTVNGGVEATLPEAASFAVDLSQVNGGFEAAFPLSIHSSPGSRHVSGEVNGGRYDLKIVTVNGDVELIKSKSGV